MKIPVEKSALSKNDQLAAGLRAEFVRSGVAVVNLMSSPGSGKTSLLELTAKALCDSTRVAAIEGDQQTDRDAERLRAAGLETALINTGRGCHLNAMMIRNVLSRFDLPALDLLLIENVGNLVCPSAFDLGQTANVVVFSTTEGHDKPGKYPEMFRIADLVVVNKMDLAEAADFDGEAFDEDLHKINPGVPVIRLSSKTGRGADGWIDWLHELVRQSSSDA